MRETAALHNQLITEIEAKMTAALQVTDTDESFRLKSCQKRKEKDLSLSRARGEAERFEEGAHEGGAA